MTKTVQAYGNYTKGKIDHDLSGRFELPIYTTGMDIFENFISNYKGNAIFSAGFVSRIAFQDCAFVEFKFGITQNYLCLFYNAKVRFLAFDTNGTFGWVLDAFSAILEVVSPYTLAEAKFISQRGAYAQNSDVMYIAHRSYAPYKLTRVSATNFTLAVYVRTADPFTGAGLFPGAVCFYKGRLYFGSTTNRPTAVWFSVAGVYDDFTIASPLTDASAFAFTITDITQQIEWLFPGDNSLIAGATDGLVAINGGGVNTAITAATVQANITSAEPTNGIYPIKREGLIFYVGRISRNVYYFKYDILSEAFVAQNANLAAYDITLNGLGKIRFKHDRNDLIFGVRGDSKLTSLVFQEQEKINGWHLRNTNGLFSDIGVIGDNLGNPQLFTLVNRGGSYYIEQQASYVEFAKRSDFWTPASAPDPQTKNANMDNEAYIRYVCEQLRACVYLDGSVSFSDLRSSTITFTPTGTDPSTHKLTGTLVSGAADFGAGDVGKHIVYKTATGYESGRYVITAYTNATTVSVTVLQDPKQKFAATLYVWASWYKSFTTLSGLAQFNGTTVGVVIDGGFLKSQAISGGAITLDNQATSICLGYQYTGIIKSMCLGFQIQGYNTQVTLKEVVRMSLRCVNSLGLKVGSSLYALQEVQLRGQGDINYLPPQPIDGTKDVDYSDDSEEDKFFYIVQDQPLPAQIANFMLEANYAVTS